MKKGKAERAFEHLDDALIVSALDEADIKGASVPTFERRKKMKNNMWKKWVSIAAMFAVVITSSIIIGSVVASASDTVIAFDVNPSLEIEINKNEKVVEVIALNEEAKTVVGDMNFKKVDLNVAVNAIIGSMVKNGYLSTDQNSILISINSNNTKKADLLKDKLSGEINTLLGNSNISASVITQSFDDSKDVNQKADANKISRAKAALIDKIVAAGLLDANGVPYTYDILAQLKVNELKLMLESKGLKIDGIASSGTASSGKYISREAALEAALQKAGVAVEEAEHIEIEFDFDDDRRAIVYEVEFRFGEKKYEYEILAESGSIVEEEIKDVKKDDDDDDDKNLTLPAEAISREAALEKAYAHAGVKAEEIKRPKIELDKEKGVLVYEIEFKAAALEYEYTINAVTGEIIEHEAEPND